MPHHVDSASTFPSGIANELKRYPTAIFTDAYKRLGMRGLIDGVTLVGGVQVGITAGRALTVGFLPMRGRMSTGIKLYDVIDSGCAGDILVISAPYPEVVLGGVVTRRAVAAGFAAIIVDGAVRDVAEIVDSGIPVWSRRQGVNRPGGFEIGSYGEPVDCAGAQVHTGDIIIADRDGAVVIPPEDASDVLEAARDTAAIEERLQRAISAKSSLDEIHRLLEAKSQPL